MPDTAGPIAAPAIAVATCESVTNQKLCESKTMPDAISVQMPGMMMQSFLCLVASTSAPAGVVISIPATPPTVITVPISPLSQPCANRNTPRNGPMPACMSAMKKFSDSSGRMPLEVGSRFRLGSDRCDERQANARNAVLVRVLVSPGFGWNLNSRASTTVAAERWPAAVASAPEADAASAGAARRGPAGPRLAAAAAQPAD